MSSDDKISSDDNPSQSSGQLRIVDRGIDTRVQIGQNNTFVTLNLPDGLAGAGRESPTSQTQTGLPLNVEAVQEQSASDKSGDDLYGAIHLAPEGSYETYNSLDLRAQTHRKQTARTGDEAEGDIWGTTGSVAQHTSFPVPKDEKQLSGNPSRFKMSDSHYIPKRQDDDKSGHFVTQAMSSEMKTVPTMYAERATQTEGYVAGDESGIHFQEVRGNYVQCGSNNNIVNIEVNKNFFPTAKGGVLTVSDSTKPLVSFTWKGNDGKVNEEVNSVKSLWTLQLEELFQSMYGEVLSHMSYSLFSPLRKIIVDIFKKYDARLTSVCSGSLLFVFQHADEESAQRMVADKEVVREMFHQLLLGMGKGEIEFTLEAAVNTGDCMEVETGGNVGGDEDVDTDPLASFPLDFEPLMRTLKSSIQQKSDEDASKRTKELKEMQERLQSMETIFERMQHSMNEHMDSTRSDMDRGRKEISEFTQTVLETVLKKKEQDQPSTGEQTPAISPGVSRVLAPLMDPKNLTSAEIYTQMEPMVLQALRCDPSCTTKQTDKPLPATERNESPQMASTRTTSPEIDEEVPKPQGEQEHVLRHGPTGDSSGSDAHFIPSKTEHLSPEHQIESVKEGKDTPSKQVYEDAEKLLTSLNVGLSSSPEVRRLTDAVVAALVDDVPPPPRAKSMDTVLCLDVSDSIGLQGLEEVKEIANNFVDGIEDIAEQHGLEENVGVVSLGGGAKVVQQLTNDYGAVRDAIDELVCHGRSPMFEALMVCVAAIKGRGGVLSVGGAHKIRPRIIFITDGRATNESTETGPDTALTDHNTKIRLIQLVSEMSPKKHSTTPHPVVWVPVGDADNGFLSSLSKLGSGNIIESKNIKNLCTYYRVEENIGRIFMCVMNNSGDWSNLDEAIEAVAEAFIGDMNPEEKNHIIQKVKEKLESKEESSVDDDPQGYDNIKELKHLPPLGSRVIRGPDWKYQNQDLNGPGTIINHADDDKLIWVLWDLNSTVCRYRFGCQHKYDICVEVDKPRTLKEDELIEIGCRVKRGADWPYQDEDGGPGNTGMVIRKRKDNSVKVRWENGKIQPCRYITQEGKFELEICSSEAPSDTGSQNVLSASAIPLKDDHKEPAPVMPTPEKPHTLWQWLDDPGQWRLYDRENNDKLTREFIRKPKGSCILQKHGRSFRVLFSLMQEKCVDEGIRHDVRRLVVDDEEKDEYIAKDISLNYGHSWT
ncbi:uncharacterized protein LOC124280401 isoform X2 [Haliotis rubra]|uniref:uncharacterized protein LOC124280401 isoform X2 n=1 Tax=Haliotis rubra TaxID=36100 RepID=UPI001EE59F97|nr:uncharacterized protein LOC124280401 isoform X2 [Haliotis rubra]